MTKKESQSKVPHFGVSNESNAYRKLSPHATRKGFGASSSLVLQVQDTNDPIHFVWNFVLGVAFKLGRKHKNTLTLTKHKTKHSD